MTALICPECRYENEAERIYCHNCGARLDRSALAKQQSEKGGEAEDPRKRLARILDPNRGRAKRFLGRAIKFLGGAAICAAIILMLLPANLPPATKSDTVAPLINMDLVAIVSSRQTAPLVYSEEQVNSYIAAVLRREAKAAGHRFFAPRRVLVRFEEGLCSIAIERELVAGLALGSGTTYRVRTENGKISAEPTRGFIGQLPIPPFLLKYGNPLLFSVWKSLAHERSSVARCAAIQFHPGTVTFVAAL